MTCWLVRHGKDDDTVRGGWSDHGLTPQGIEQVHALARESRNANLNIDGIYSSDLRRAKETAAILAEYLQLPIEFLPEFRETNNGYLAGMKHELAERKYPGLYWSSLDYTECYPGGESPKMFFDRISAAWKEFRENVQKQSDRNVMLVTHGGVIEVILCIENNTAYSNKQKQFSTPNARLIPVEL